MEVRVFSGALEKPREAGLFCSEVLPGFRPAPWVPTNTTHPYPPSDNTLWIHGNAALPPMSIRLHRGGWEVRWRDADGPSRRDDLVHHEMQPRIDGPVAGFDLLEALLRCVVKLEEEPQPLHPGELPRQRWVQGCPSIGTRPTGAWTDDEIAREESATRKRLSRDREAGAAANVRAAGRSQGSRTVSPTQRPPLGAMEALDPEPLLRFLHERGVEHILIGGVAVVLSGAPGNAPRCETCRARAARHRRRGVARGRELAELPAAPARPRGHKRDRAPLRHLERHVLAAGSVATEGAIARLKGSSLEQ